MKIELLPEIILYDEASQRRRIITASFEFALGFLMFFSEMSSVHTGCKLVLCHSADHNYMVIPIVMISI